MFPDIISHYRLDDDDIKNYKVWLKTPLAEKIDAVVDANSYKYNFILVYNAEKKFYRRVGDSIDIRWGEIPLYISTPCEPLKTELEVLNLIDNTMEIVKIEIGLK